MAVVQAHAYMVMWNNLEQGCSCGTLDQIGHKPGTGSRGASGLKIGIAIGTPGEANHWLRVEFELVALRSIGYSTHE